MSDREFAPAEHRTSLVDEPPAAHRLQRRLCAAIRSWSQRMPSPISIPKERPEGRAERSMGSQPPCSR